MHDAAPHRPRRWWSRLRWRAAAPAWRAATPLRRLLPPRRTLPPLLAAAAASARARSARGDKRRRRRQRRRGDRCAHAAAARASKERGWSGWGGGDLAASACRRSRASSVSPPLRPPSRPNGSHAHDNNIDCGKTRSHGGVASTYESPLLGIFGGPGGMSDALRGGGGGGGGHATDRPPACSPASSPPKPPLCAECAVGWSACHALPVPTPPQRADGAHARSLRVGGGGCWAATSAEDNPSPLVLPSCRTWPGGRYEWRDGARHCRWRTVQAGCPSPPSPAPAPRSRCAVEAWRPMPRPADRLAGRLLSVHRRGLSLVGDGPYGCRVARPAGATPAAAFAGGPRDWPPPARLPPDSRRRYCVPSQRPAAPHTLPPLPTLPLQPPPDPSGRHRT